MTVHAGSDAPRHAVLVTPTQCVTSESMLCDPSTYLTNATSHAVVQPFDELVDPITRLKLELAGYTLTDARTHR